MDAIQGRVAFSPEPHAHDEGGAVLTAYAPIKDASGNVKALLRADDGDIGSMADLRSLVRATCFALLLFPVLISWWLAHVLTRRFVDPTDFLKELRKGLAATAVAASEPAGHAMAAESTDGAKFIKAASEKTADELQRPEFVLWHELKPNHKTVALAVGEGLTNAEIAARLCLSVSRIRQILNEIYGILGIDSGNRRAMLAVVAASMGGLGGSDELHP